MNQEKFYRSLSQLTDRDISPELFHELEQYLLSSEQARQQYHEYMQLQSLVGLEIDVHHRNEKLLPIERILFRQKRRAVYVALVSAAAVILLSLVAMRFYLMPEPESRDLAFEVSPGTQFVLSHDSDQGEVPSGNLMQPGSRLQISQGTVELQFASGVKSVVMAPADLTMRSENKLYLKEGRAWFHVPEQAIGFEVKTGDLNIVDLGTEFGVLAQPGQHDEVHVLKGKVQVTAQRLRKGSEILTAGDARRIDPVGRLTDIPVKSTAFLNQLPDTLPYLHWSFDQEDGFQVKGTHPVVADVTTTAQESPLLVSGKNGRALLLNGGTQYVSTNWPGFSGARPRTVAFWIKLPEDGQPHEFAGILGWGDNTQKNAKWEVLTRQDPVNSRGRISIFWGQSSIKTGYVIPAGSWHHVVITDSGTVDLGREIVTEIYIDGERLKELYGDKSRKAMDTVTYTKDAIPFTVGVTIRHQSVESQRRFLKASLDELYIFDGAMTEQQIRQFVHTQISQSEKNKRE